MIFWTSYRFETVFCGFFTVKATDLKNIFTSMSQEFFSLSSSPPEKISSTLDWDLTVSSIYHGHMDTIILKCDCDNIWISACGRVPSLRTNVRSQSELSLRQLY